MTTKPESKFFVCHAGSGIDDPDHEMGVINMLYRWDGEWIIHPDEVAGRDKDPVMKLTPAIGDSVEVFGVLACFTSIEDLQFLEDPRY